MPHLVDVMHLGNDRVIGANELDGGIVIDPGPASCVETLLAGLREEPRVLLLTHIHLDHAGASGVLARRFPKLRVYVHEVGAPHLVDPSKLLVSAERLYGDEMDRLWGEVAPVPSEQVVVLGGNETVEGMRVAHTPGHAGHHVCYFDEDAGEAYVGDVAGARVPPDGPTTAPTPPPEIDLEAWKRSLELVEAWGAKRLHLTHFGPRPAGEQIESMREALANAEARSRDGDRESFLAAFEADLGGASPDVRERTRQATVPEHLWLGLERYWRKQREREE
jgi:glyoxylase-like metal-dependent hydrolase (beta-lactamase superfamily II)